MISSRDQPAVESSYTDRAVSDMIAFVLVFAVILASVALLSTVGFQAMTDYQEGEQLRNAERAMISLADNFNGVLRYDGIEQRYGELSLREGTITTGTGGTTVNVASKNGTISKEIDLGTFAYSDGSDTIAYEGGGVVRSDGEGSVVLKRPLLTCNPGSSQDGTAIISLVRIVSAERSIQSNGGLGVTMSVTDRERNVHNGVGSVTVSIDDPEYDGAWTAIQNSGGWNDGTCKNVDRAVVTVVDVELEY